MARGIAFADFIYEIDNGLDGVNGTAIIASMLLKMDKYNVGTGKTKITKSSLTEPLVAAHCSLNLNENQFGVHPRYVIGEFVLPASSSNCYGTQPKRLVQIPVLTLTQFNTLKVYNKLGAATQADTTIEVNHSQNGSAKSPYRIIKKVFQNLI